MSAGDFNEGQCSIGPYFYLEDGLKALFSDDVFFEVLDWKVPIMRTNNAGAGMFSCELNATYTPPRASLETELFKSQEHDPQTDIFQSFVLVCAVRDIVNSAHSNTAISASHKFTVNTKKLQLSNILEVLS
jgi:Na+/alanine symporter